METVAVSELRSNLMRILKRIERGSIITITSRGRPIARMLPPENSMMEAREKLKTIRETASVGDVVSPIDEEWEAMK
ncbi:MAG: type II toxin-antitoxin system prevent-host-death family antitoxin [bacterium]